MAYFATSPKVELNVELLACRVCLATDTKLFHLPTHPIAQTYALLTGTELSLTDGLPQHICTICSSQLLKHAALRAKCRTAQVVLQVAQAANQLLTTEYLQNVDRTDLRHNLFSTNIQYIDVIPEKTCKNLAGEINSSNSQQIDLTVDDDAGNILPDDRAVSDCDEKKEIFIELMKNDDDTFGCIAKDVDYTPIKNNDNSLLPDCLIGLAKDVFKDSVENYKETKSKIKKTNIKSELKQVKRVASNTNTKTDSLDCKIGTKIVKKEIKRKKATKVETNKKTKIRKVQEDEKKVTRNVEFIRRRRSKRTLKDIKSNWSKMYNVDVVLLSKEEQRKQLEARKQTIKYLNSAYKCEICFKAFSEESMFKEHMTIHDPSRGELLCDVCHRYFSTKKALGNHSSKQHRMILVCKQCSFVSKTVMSARDHYNSHNGVKVKCDYCEKVFNKLKTKIEHIRIQHGSSLCVICGDGFTGAHGLKLHMKLTHPEASDAVCSTCSVQFHSAEALSKHACEPGALPCAQCGDSFSTEETLNQHQQEQHKKEIECKTCNRMFTSDRWYKTHCINVHGLRSKEVFETAGRLWVKRHRNQDFMCEICGTCHQNEATLINHQRIHSGEKPYKCEHCPKSFRLKMQRQLHMYTHTGERPYKCPDCPKAFKSASAKFRHYLVHSKKRPHVCDICGKTYQTTTVVKMHIRTVHLKEALPRRVRPRRTNSHKTP